jgi:hypothetical protein
VQKTRLNGSDLSANGPKTPIDLLVAELRELSLQHRRLMEVMAVVLQQNAQILQILTENDLIEGEEPLAYLDGTPVKS